MKKQYRSTFQGPVLVFFSTRHLFPNHTSDCLPNVSPEGTYLPCRDRVLLGSIRGSTGLCEALLLLTQLHVPMAFLAPICFQSLTAVSNRKGQNLKRAWKSWKIYCFPFSEPFSLLLHFSEEETTGFASFLKPFFPRGTEGDSQELHTTDWDTWAVSPLKAQLCLCHPAQDLWCRLPQKDISAPKPPWLNHCMVFPSKCRQLRKGKSSF